MLDIVTVIFQDLTPLFVYSLIKGSTSFLLAALIFIYLMKKNIKSIFTESPNSLFILGSFLFFYGLKHDSGIALVEYFWLTMSIVGFAMLRAGQQRRKSLGIIANYINTNKSKT
jgi:hypothetical protein